MFPHLLDLIYEEFKKQHAAPAAVKHEAPAKHAGKGGKAAKAPKSSGKEASAEDFLEFARKFLMGQYGASLSSGYGHGGTVVRLVDGTLAQLFPLPGEGEPPANSAPITQATGTQPLPGSGAVDIFATPESYKPGKGFR